MGVAPKTSQNRDIAIGGPDGRIEREAESLAEILKVVAHPLRLRLLNALLEGEATVTDLTVRLGVKQALVSQHLAKMRSLGLVAVQRGGGWSRYSLAMSGLRGLLSCLNGCHRD